MFGKIKRMGPPTAVMASASMITLLLIGGTYGSINYQAHAQQLSKPSPELTAQWWQYALSVPTFDDCSLGSFGDTLFLAGTTGGSAERECTVSQGQSILIPITNCIGVKSEETDTAQSLASGCAELIDQLKNAKLRIDGTFVRNLKTDFRVQESSFFTIVAADNNPFGATSQDLCNAESCQAVSDGIWVLVPSDYFTVGEHTISFVGKLHGHTSDGKIDFATKVTYHLTVVP